MSDYKSSSPFIITDNNETSIVEGGAVSLVDNPDKTDTLAVAELPKTECAPKLIDGTDGVCSSAESVEKIRKWLSTENNDAKQIVEEAKQETGCDSESCLYQKIPILNKAELEERFNPKGPWDSKKWLSNVDIDRVLDMWQDRFPDFRHINFQMRDFADTNSELSRTDWAAVYKRYKYAACILNTDTSRGPGEHWVAFFVDIPGRTVEYFDSAGNKPHDEFLQLIVSTASALTKASGHEFVDHTVTSVEHQKGNSECGVYSLYYVISRLNGVPYTAFEYQRVADDVMVQFRKFLFRHS